MSPFTLRRFRAERLLRDEFDRLRARVLGGVSARLRVAGVHLDASDLDAAYSQAWQGLYAAVLDGCQIASTEGWLATVTYRRAIDEHRARRRTGEAVAAAPDVAESVDLAERVHDSARLRELFEALRGRLDAREREAATLCYLHGLSRADAAARMGIGERRMQRLMDGRGAGSPGVSQKVGVLLATIAAGRWCEEQGSLMRGYAYGVLDPAGERHSLAEAHSDACPACRAYVRSLRGLAAVLPPVPSLLHVLAPGALAGGAAAGSGAASGAGAAAAGAGTAGSGGGASAAATAALSASGAAGAGGGWWLAGPLGAKLAAGCLLALGVGAGCVALEGAGTGGGGHARPRHARSASADRRAAPSPSGGVSGEQLAAAQTPGEAASVATADARAPARVASAKQASREFGPEQPASGAVTGSTGSPTAGAASVGGAPAVTARNAGAGAPGGGAEGGAGSTRGAGLAAAQREFAPG